jgi:hypothetical protein
MKSLRLTAALVVLGCCSALSFADVVPVDGGIGLKHDGHSTPITSLTQALTFSACAGAVGDVAFDCALFGGAQAIFAGVNETGFAFNSISIGLSGYSQTSDPIVTCDGGGVFQICSVSVSGSNLTVDYFQGNGTGVGCINPLLPHDDPTNVACRENSRSAIYSNKHYGTDLPYYRGPNQLTGPCKSPEKEEEDEGSLPPGRVCGTDGFVVALGYDGKPFNQPLSLEASFTANNAPEPPTLVLFGSGMLALLLFGIKKARFA